MSVAGAAAAPFDVLTRTGRVVTLRAALPSDRESLLALHERASPRDRYRRFFSAATSLAGEVERLLRPGDDHATLVAAHGADLVGVASFETVDRTTGELAVLVDAAWQGLGLGTLLLEHLAATAGRAGLAVLVGDVLADNAPMLELAQGVAPHAVRRHPDEPGVLQVVVATDPDEAAGALSAERDRVAERASLRPLLRPTSVAVVGAGRHPGTVGHEVVRALRRAGFRGSLHLVNPSTPQVDGLPTVDSVLAVEGPVDLAVVAVPAPLVPGVLEQCAARGVGAAVVLSSGFGETGTTGARTQAALVATARAHGLRLLGPNCLGLVENDPDVRLAATFAAALPPAGHLAVGSQSGAVGVAVLEAAARDGLGVSAFVSLGNRADVSTNDLLAWWHDDERTHAVALYVESFGNPRRFAWLARTLGRRKPVLVVKSGRSAGGRRAGASHTAAAFAPPEAVSALFRQAGVVACDTLGELLDAARLLVDQPLPAGRRLGVVGNAGGLNVLAADAAGQHGLEVPELAAGDRDLLRTLAPAAAGVSNPVDLGAGAGAAVLEAALHQVAGAVDAVLVTLVGTAANDLPALLAALGTAADAHPQLPVAAVVVGGACPRTLGRRRLPVYDLPEDAVRALAHAARHAAWRRTPVVPAARPDADVVRARRLVAGALATAPGWQPAAVSGPLLRAYGVDPVPTTVADDAAAAVSAADGSGYPVVLKTADPTVVHKSRAGLVRPGLADADAVRHAYADLATRHPDPPAVLVQPMVPGGVELVVGVVHDPVFGSVVMLGAGGTSTELVADRTFVALPLSEPAAQEAWRSLRVATLLSGGSGQPAVDTAALTDLLLRVARLADDLPEVAELDLNPVVASPRGVAVVDVRLRLAAVPSETGSPLVRLG